MRFNPGLLRIIKLACFTVLCCHWFGCLWWLVSALEMDVVAIAEDASLGTPWYAGDNHWHPPPWLKHTPSLSLKYSHAFFWGAGMALGMVPRDARAHRHVQSL